MARERTVVKGIVLRAVDTKESDRILTLLTAQGKLPVVAKGARSRRSRVTACTQLLAYGELTLSESRGWQYLTEGSTIELFQGVRGDIGLLSLASYFAELTEAVAQENTESGEVLSLLLNALYALGTLKRPEKLVKAAFELRLMGAAGFEPLTDACACCGVPDPAEPLLDTAGGVIRCRQCGRGEHGLSMPLSPASLTAMRWVLRQEVRHLCDFRLPDRDLALLADAAEAYVHTVLERGFRTLDFYKSLS